MWSSGQSKSPGSTPPHNPQLTPPSIEANCVLIGACIPTLYPLVKKVFGSSALGGSTPNKDNSGPPGSDTIVTIGSGDKRRKKKVMSLFELETATGTESRDEIITS